MKAKRKGTYVGELNKPIVVPFWHRYLGGEWLGSEQGRAEKDAWIAAAEAKKLKLLCDHFSICPTSKDVWLRLAYALAKQHVPGMRVIETPKAKRGRPKIQSDRDLALEIDKLNSERRKGIWDAIRQLRKRNPKTWGPCSEATLRKRYYEWWKGIPKNASIQQMMGAFFERGFPEDL